MELAQLRSHEGEGAGPFSAKPSGLPMAWSLVAPRSGHPAPCSWPPNQAPLSGNVHRFLTGCQPQPSLNQANDKALAQKDRPDTTQPTACYGPRHSKPRKTRGPTTEQTETTEIPKIPIMTPTKRKNMVTCTFFVLPAKLRNEPILKNRANPITARSRLSFDRPKNT